VNTAVEGESRTTLIVEQREKRMGVAVKGACPLWTTIVQAYQTWLNLEKPGYSCLTLVIAPEGYKMQIEYKEHLMTLDACYHFLQ
jgi:hypothetical protein